MNEYEERTVVAGNPSPLRCPADGEMLGKLKWSIYNPLYFMRCPLCGAKYRVDVTLRDVSP